MTVLGVAHYLRCSPITIHRLLRERAIPGFRVGDWRFRRSAIDLRPPAYPNR
jgi:excisionase family DNA binding protein